jgi:hypothetical protein
MKIVSTTLALTLLASLYTFANTAKVSEPSKKVYQVLQGDSSQAIEHKRGLAVDLEYSSEHVDVNQLSQVEITLLTQLKKGTLTVELSSMNGALEGIKQTQYQFELMEVSGENKFPINLQVKSDKEGIHYINLTVSLEGDETRVMAVPVNVGEVSKTIQKQTLTTREDGDTMRVSQAVEEIK